MFGSDTSVIPSLKGRRSWFLPQGSNQGFWWWGSWTGSISIPWNLLEIHILGTNPQPTDQTLRVGPSKLGFNKPSGWFWWHTSVVTTALESILSFSHSVMSDSLWPHELQHARLPCPSPSPGVCSNSRPLSQWCHPTISSFVAPFSSCPQSFPASGSFPMSWLFASRSQSIGASATASAPVLPMNIKSWINNPQVRNATPGHHLVLCYGNYSLDTYSIPSRLGRGRALSTKRTQTVVLDRRAALERTCPLFSYARNTT